MYTHNLATTTWSKLSFVEQMANVGSEVFRAIHWRKKANQQYAQLAFYRALDLMDGVLENTHTPSQLRELTRLRASLVDYFAGDNTFASSERTWRGYFDAFTFAAARVRGL